MSVDPLAIDPDLRRLAEEIGRSVVEQLWERLRRGDGNALVLPQYFSPRQAAVFTGISAKKLEALRHKGTGPRFHRVGARIHYAVADLRRFIEEEGRGE